MQLPSYLKGDGLKSHAIALGVGVIATLVIGFTWGGWVRGSTARRMTDTAVTAEIVALYTPQCVKRFEAQTNMPEQWAALKKANADYNQQDFIEKTGFATLPGAKEPNDDVASACVDKLTTALSKQRSQQANTKS
jgi:alpha/beta superfamily hydrolase